MTRPDFEAFDSIPRLSRDMVITEKLDGTNASVIITEDGDLFAASRTRYVEPGNDNFGFAAWAYGNRDELLKLGPGRHFGEWFGLGIQRGYGLSEKRFALFNTHRWHSEFNDPAKRLNDTRCLEVPVCHVVPVLDWYTFDTGRIDTVLANLAEQGSAAALGFMKPEGIVVYHTKANVLFKKTLDKNDGHKSNA